jgi:hypothetical protein
MGLSIYRSKIKQVADHAYHLLECLEKYGAYIDSEPVLRVSKQALVAAMQDPEDGAAIAKAFRADLKTLEDDEDEVTFYLDY